MYSNIDSTLMYFVRFKEYATKEKGLNLKQSEADPCLFYRRAQDGTTEGVVVVYVDDCLIAGK